jgi:hypothetical protein
LAFLRHGFLNERGYFVLSFILSVVQMLLSLWINRKPPEPIEAAPDPRSAEFFERKRV